MPWGLSFRTIGARTIHNRFKAQSTFENDSSDLHWKQSTEEKSKFNENPGTGEKEGDKKKWKTVKALRKSFKLIRGLTQTDLKSENPKWKILVFFSFFCNFSSFRWINRPPSISGWINNKEQKGNRDRYTDR